MDEFILEFNEKQQQFHHNIQTTLTKENTHDWQTIVRNCTPLLYTTMCGVIYNSFTAPYKIEDLKHAAKIAKDLIDKYTK